MEQVNEDDTIMFVADLTIGKIACVLLQAGLGGNRDICHLVDTDCWFLAPTDDMKMYKVRRGDIPDVVKYFKAQKEKRNKLD